MKIYIGADHNGYHLKQALLEYLNRAGYEVIDEGDRRFDASDDFPQFAGRVVSGLLASGDPEARGILICGSGQGMCIAANRFKGVRASLVWDREEARMSRSEDDANILCLPARFVRKEEVPVLVETWLNTPFAAAARYIRRNKELDELV